jgi:Na+/H+ antiporter NhaA
VKILAVYLMLACALWAAVLVSGVHPTIAGVLTAHHDSDPGHAGRA